MPAFKFDSSSCFLTYAQSNLTHTEIFQHLNGIKLVDWARVCTELHADGLPHQHVVARWTTRVQSRDQGFLDIQGRHPNIQPVRSIKRALEYVTKDGQFTDFGSVPSGSGESIDWKEQASVLSEYEFFKLASEQRLSCMYAKKFWELCKPAKNEIGTGYVPDLTRESEELLLLPAVPGSQVLIGASGVGKTSWAKRVCQKPALWVRHLDMLKTLRPEHKCIIFDDMSFMHLPRETQIQLVDQTDEAHVHIRYGVAVIQPNTQKIFTANSDPFLDDPAINRRITKTIL